MGNAALDELVEILTHTDVFLMDYDAVRSLLIGSGYEVELLKRSYDVMQALVVRVRKNDEDYVLKAYLGLVYGSERKNLMIPIL